MLVAQAKYARDLFINGEVNFVDEDDNIEKLYLDLIKEQQNVVLIGMAGCGKSTIGKVLASILNKEFVDTDQLVEIKAGLSIPEIFEKFGEEKFREIEREVVNEVSLKRNSVIATGGGVVVNPNNKFSLKCSGKVVWIKRNLDKLAIVGRPLYNKQDSKIKLYKERENLYNDFADMIVSNDDNINDTVKKVVKLCGY